MPRHCEAGMNRYFLKTFICNSLPNISLIVISKQIYLFSKISRSTKRMLSLTTVLPPPAQLSHLGMKMKQHWMVRTILLERMSTTHRQLQRTIAAQHRYHTMWKDNMMTPLRYWIDKLEELLLYLQTQDQVNIWIHLYLSIIQSTHHTT